MTKTINLFCLMIFLFVAACGKNKRPGLSDKELFAQKATTETLQQELVDFDAESYVVPPGIKYTESRAVDPANPPVVLDIANRKLNIRKFDLSDYYTKVRYIKLKHPMPPKEGNFIFGLGGRIISMSGECHINIASAFYSQFEFADDYIIAGDACFGLHCYDKEGKFLYTIESNEYPKTYDASERYISLDLADHKGFYGKVTAKGNNCFYSLIEDNKSLLCIYDLT